MPRFFHCIHCGQPHTTADECRQHEAECNWRIKALADKELRACPSCGNLDDEKGRYCLAKGGELITEPVTLCRWWANPTLPAQADQTEAAEELLDEAPALDSRPLAQGVA